MKIVQALEESNILLERITKTIENETKNKKEDSYECYQVRLGASLLGNRKIVLEAGVGNKQGKRISRTGYGSKGSPIGSF